MAESERETQTLEDESGRRIAETEYLRGKPHGLSRTWSPEGVLTQEAEMEFGEYHGRYRSWWENGNKREEGRFYRGRKVGLYRWYAESGFLLKEEDYGPGL